ncbi:precorrin-3B synthase [Gordonia sp. DT30]|uniref:precorrin-3B synthase n=1 Tax=Gordonia sp. DT30 TaxID=3416546 RepID=UPI003CFA570E
MNEPVQRPTRDRCPGVVDPHPAADGALARIRLLGGALTPAQMQTLAQVSAEFGDGFLELTARANIQVRGIADVDAVAERLTAAGLLPGGDREKIRNIDVSSLTGRISGHIDVRDLAEALDAALRTDHGLTGLSGRFLFGVDDGRGDVVARRPDVCAVVRPGAHLGTLSPADILIDGTPAGSVADRSDAPSAMIDVARDMVRIAAAAESGSRRPWRVRDLDAGGRNDLIGSARARLATSAAAPDAAETVRAPSAPVVGWFEQDDGLVLLGAVVELGRLPARPAEFLAAIGAPIIVTPDREILICDLTEGAAETVVRVLAPMGVIFDADSPWVKVSSCAGAPGCVKSHAPVRADVAQRVDSDVAVTEREHWVGCARGCGSPAQSHMRVEAGPGGYRRQRIG